MSWSCRSVRSRHTAASGVCVLAGLVGLPAGSAAAADTYVQPRVDLRVENNDNFYLTPGGSADSDIYGYIADAQALIGIATPRSDTSMRPRVRFQEYPDSDEMERFEAFFDLRSRYTWERSEFLLLGKYDRQDSHNADQPTAEFDPLDPTDPANPGSATSLVGETRNRFEIRPEYKHDVTERVRLGVDGTYEVVRYDSDAVSTNTEYDYAAAGGSVRWKLTPVSGVNFGAYASKYEARDDSTDTDAYGGEVGYDYRWSEVTGVEVSVFYEQNDITNFQPVRSEDSTSGWGGGVTAYRKGEVSEWRLTAGRTFIPTGDGGKAESDQFRVQYDRDLRERLSFRGGARYEARTMLDDGRAGNDRDYARVDLRLEWLLAPTWYINGGYSYIWQDRESDSGSADNNRLFIGFGYRGLKRQSR